MNSQEIATTSTKLVSFLPFIFKKAYKTHHQLLRYAVVGGCAYVVDFGTLFVLTDYFKMFYLISAALAFTMGLITNYTLSILWVFSKRSVSDKRVEFLIFALIGVIGLGFNEGTMWFFTSFVHLHYLISKLISTVFVFFWNFYARKRILFS
jgi:putative flippase GtrA